MEESGTAALRRDDLGCFASAVVVDVEDGTFGDFGLEGLVRFLRSELDIDGPVEVLRR